MPVAPARIGAATTEEEVENMRSALDRMKFSFTSYSHEVMQELRDGERFGSAKTESFVASYVHKRHGLDFVMYRCVWC